MKRKENLTLTQHDNQFDSLLARRPVRLVRKLEELETKYNNLVLRCVLVSIFGFSVFIAGSVDDLWSAMLSEYNRVSTQSAQVHTMFGKEVELKYTARAIALCLFFVILFVTWPILSFVTSIGLYTVRTIVRRKRLFLVMLFLLTASMGAIWYYEYTDEVQVYFESATGNASALFDSIIKMSSKKQDL